MLIYGFPTTGKTSAVKAINALHESKFSKLCEVRAVAIDSDDILENMGVFSAHDMLGVNEFALLKAVILARYNKFAREFKLDNSVSFMFFTNSPHGGFDVGYYRNDPALVRRLLKRRLEESGSLALREIDSMPIEQWLSDIAQDMREAILLKEGEFILDDLRLIGSRSITCFELSQIRSFYQRALIRDIRSTLPSRILRFLRTGGKKCKPDLRLLQKLLLKIEKFNRTEEPCR